MIKQPNRWSCFACAAAMATGETLQAVIDFIGHDGSGIYLDRPHRDKRQCFTLCEIVGFLASRGFVMGLPVESTLITIMRKILCVHRSTPAIVIVQGAEFNHAIFWDGQQVHDPAPGVPEYVRLSEYQVLQWWPLRKVSMSDLRNPRSNKPE